MIANSYKTLLLALTWAALSQAPEHRIDEARERGVLHGAVLVAHDGEIQVHSANGKRAPGAEPITLETRFQIASLSKLLTQVAVARLVQDEALDLDAPLGETLVGLPDWLAHEVTARHLLDMTSGLPRELAADPAASGIDLDADGSVLPFLDAFDVEPVFAPGTGRSYSNVGYWLLGAVVEATTDTSFEQAVRDNVLGPLEMDSTGLTRVEGAFAMGLVRTEDDLDLAPEVDYSRRYSSGGFFSTTGDLYRLCRGLDDGSFLSEEARAIVFGDDESVFIAGMLPGFMNVLSHDARAGTTVIALNNVVADDPNAFIGLVRALAEPTQAPAGTDR